MAAIPKEELEQKEQYYGLEEDGLTYQQRCSRIAAYDKGEGDDWVKPESKEKPKYSTDIKQHPLYGKRLFITPLMVPDKNRNVYFEEKIGHEIQVSEVHAGELLHGQPEDIDRMVGDYKLVHEDKSRPIMAKTTFPKIGTEISWLFGKEICPTVRGNDGQRGYLWSFPTSMLQFDDTLVQVYGLKTLITAVYPELLQKFSGKPMMSYIDGVTLVASIPLTNALLKEQKRKEMLDAKAGLI